MKLFLKEHRFLIVIQIVQFTVFSLLFWLGGFRDIALIFYTVFLGVFFLFLYLFFKYNAQKKLYERLSTPIATLDESQGLLGYNHLSVALADLLKAQYNLYEQEIIALRKKQEEQFIFIDRWIHQMKTPLSILELTAKELDEPESSNIREEIDRMKTGLQITLYMARLRSIEQDFHVEKINVNKIISEVNKDNKRLFIRNGVYPRIIKDPSVTTVYSDEKWLYFILTQLIQNAVKYSTGQAQRLHIGMKRQDKKTFIQIEDEGIGIPKADLKRIFNLFFTGENGRHYRESTGVGLYLVKEVVDYLGHEIEVESEVGKGTLFRLIL